ncbi:hypothetical protein F1559_001303 [Cyanidiococcus yangmingshanensis]|uniref:tRNA-binding domain-containing protein n=1 Tax=Cyanidiococcus yangmingshanensis TaxID=2690220 RepID=A0A7J7IGE0_9RHOD|nr:hypothetical protein F1559_001303 [Cyanidiococcus yangmingshanensis]
MNASSTRSLRNWKRSIEQCRALPSKLDFAAVCPSVGWRISICRRQNRGISSNRTPVAVSDFRSWLWRPRSSAFWPWSSNHSWVQRSLRLSFGQIGLQHSDESNRLPKCFNQAQLADWKYGVNEFVFGKPQHLFKKIEPSLVEEFRKRFAGEATESAANANIGVAATDAELELDLRLGRISQCTVSEQSERLYHLVLDLGATNTPRHAAANLVDVFPSPSDLIGRLVVVCCNLEPAVLGGIRSEVMVLVAEKRARLSLLTVQGAQPAMVGALVVPQPEKDSTEQRTRRQQGSFPESLDRKGLQTRLKTLRVRSDGVVVWKQSRPLVVDREYGAAVDNRGPEAATTPPVPQYIIVAASSEDTAFWNNARIR